MTELRFDSFGYLPAAMAAADGQVFRPEDPDGPVRRARAKQRQFVSDASHELGTPVAALRARLEEARLHPDQTDLHDLLDHALDDVARLQAILGDLLLLATIDEGTPGPARTVDLARLVREEISARMDRLPMRLRLTPGVLVDAVGDHLARAVTHLLDNAQRHAARMVTVELGRHAGYAELTVADDGKGIARKDRRRVFERFSRLDTARCRRDGGPGLSLAIVHDVVLHHGGTIHIEEPETGGARFVIRIPLSPVP